MRAMEATLLPKKHPQDWERWAEERADYERQIDDLIDERDQWKLRFENVRQFKKKMFRLLLNKGVDVGVYTENRKLRKEAEAWRKAYEDLKDKVVELRLAAVMK